MTRTYRSRAELRQLVLDYGVRVLLDEGFRSGGLTLRRVFEEIERDGLPRVTKGSVLGVDRIWPTQAEFEVDVEVEVVRRWAAEELELPPTVAAVEAVLSRANLNSLAGRHAAVRELCRLAGRANFESNRSSRLWKLVIALWGRIAANPETDRDRRIAVAIDTATRQVTTDLVDDLYRPLMQLVGYRGRPEFGSTEEAIRLLATSGYALNDGFTLRDEFTSSNDVELTGSDGEVERWIEFSIALEGLVNRYLEPDRRWRPVSGASSARPSGDS